MPGNRGLPTAILQLKSDKSSSYFAEDFEKVDVPMAEASANIGLSRQPSMGSDVGGTGSTRWGWRGDYMPPLTIYEAIEIRAKGIFQELRPLEGKALKGPPPTSNGGHIDQTFEVAGNTPLSAGITTRTSRPDGSAFKKVSSGCGIAAR